VVAARPFVKGYYSYYHMDLRPFTATMAQTWFLSCVFIGAGPWYHRAVTIQALGMATRGMGIGGVGLLRLARGGLGSYGWA